MSIELYFGLVSLAVAGWLLWRWSKVQWRKKLYRQPLAAEYVKLLEDNVGLYPLLPPELQQVLHGHVNYFLATKDFFGCDGLEITDEIRLTIAGNACLLVLRREQLIFQGFTSILVYPGAYVASQQGRDGDVVYDEDSVRAGESWFRGPVVLSWADVKSGTLNEVDGHNVVLHEFAHKLDEESGVMDGLPVLRQREHYAQYTRLLNEQYSEFLDRVDNNKNNVIDEYGSVSPAEFFAVLTETFFEKPAQLQARLPELYAEVARFYALDPVAWHADAESA